MTAKLLGIDIGTGGTRAVLVDAQGRVLASATAEHAPMSSPKIGWAEQHPDDWWRAACRAIPDCLAKAGASPNEISGIGLTGQMHGLFLLDAAGEVLRPSIIWCDQRTEEQCREITGKVGARRPRAQVKTLLGIDSRNKVGSGVAEFIVAVFGLDLQRAGRALAELRRVAAAEVIERLYRFHAHAGIQ